MVRAALARSKKSEGETWLRGLAARNATYRDCWDIVKHCYRFKWAGPMSEYHILLNVEVMM